MRDYASPFKWVIKSLLLVSIPTLQAQVSESDLLLRVNCGGNDVMINSKFYEEDLFFDNGSTFSNFDNNDIVNTEDDTVYKTERTQNGGFSYTIPITNGTYTVRLHFAEIFHGAPGRGAGGSGKRVFSVEAEGSTIISDLDINDTVGPITAHIEQHDITITDGEMNLDFIDIVDQPKISALEIYGSGTITRPIDTSCEWETLTSSSIARVEAQSIVVDNLLYVFAGFEAGIKITGVTESYDPFFDSWATLAPMPVPVTHMGIAAVGDKIWIVGGFTGDHPGVATDLVQIYDTVNDTWSNGTSLPNERGSLAVAYNGTKIHALGGLLPDRNTDVGEHYAFDTANPSAGWVELEDMPEPRNHHSAAAVDGKLYAIGGQRGHDMGTDDQKFLHEYNPVNDTWTRKADLLGDRSHFEPGTIVYEGKIIIVGGRNGGQFFREITEYDPVNDEWTELCSLPDKVLAPVAKVIGTELIVTNGGINGVCCPTDRALKVDLMDDVTLNSDFNSLSLVEKGITIYPNPSDGLISFKGTKEIKSFVVSVLDASGKAIYENNEVYSTNNLDLTKLERGVYFMKISTGDTYSIQKLILE